MSQRLVKIRRSTPVSNMQIPILRSAAPPARQGRN